MQFTYYAIKEVNGNRFIGNFKKSFGKNSLVSSTLSSITECPPRLYKSKQGATYSMQYWKGLVKDKFTILSSGYYSRKNSALVVVPITLSYEEVNNAS